MSNRTFFVALVGLWPRSETSCVPNPEGHKGTGKAFGGWISKCLLEGAKENLAIVSADLAVSCGISEVLEHPRCYEMGVAEQNAIAFASGLAATGMLPVVATYSAFFKRAYEQIYIAQVSGFRMVYAGSYSGLCYHTDGKSHTHRKFSSIQRSP